MDLITWHEGQTMVGFQLCYDKGVDEHAFTWMKDSGWTHRKIEDGEETGGHHKMTPILVPDGVIDMTRIRSEFVEASAEIDEEIRDFVLSILEQTGIET
jgi:hypothetical protein